MHAWQGTLRWHFFFALLCSTTTAEHVSASLTGPSHLSHALWSSRPSFCKDTLFSTTDQMLSSSPLIFLPFNTLSAGHAPKRWILYTTTSISKTSNRTIVGPACELLLHGLREYRSLDIRVGGRLLGEFPIKVRSVKRIGLRRSVFVIKTNTSNGAPTTLGLNVGSYLRCSNFLQSIALKNGWALISEGPLAPSLCSGLRSRSCIKRSFAGSGTISGPGKWRVSDSIFRYISLVFSS